MCIVDTAVQTFVKIENVVICPRLGPRATQEANWLLRVNRSQERCVGSRLGLIGDHSSLGVTPTGAGIVNSAVICRVIVLVPSRHAHGVTGKIFFGVNTTENRPMNAYNGGFATAPQDASNRNARNLAVAFVELAILAT